MTKQISWKTKPEEFDTISAVADRAANLAKSADIFYDKRMALMDITACHANGNPLDLAALLAADDGTFGHDVFGIRRHINRNTGALEDCFSPRTSAKV